MSLCIVRKDPIKIEFQCVFGTGDLLVVAAWKV